MIDSIKGLLSDWQYGREIVKCLINELSDSELDKTFPRRKLNSIRKQCLELIQIQSCYVKALESGEINFKCNPVYDTSKDVLLKEMSELDFLLQKNLENFNGEEIISWHG